MREIYVSLGNNQSGYTGYLGIGTVKTQGSPLYIRNSKVYTEESKLGQIPNGNKVNVYDCGDSKWYRVEYNGITGYASAEYITLSPSYSGGTSPSGGTSSSGSTSSRPPSSSSSGSSSGNTAPAVPDNSKEIQAENERHEKAVKNINAEYSGQIEVY